MEPVEQASSPEQTLAEIKALRVSIESNVNEVGRLADWCSGEDGNETTGVHPLQMCYDRLREAEMWLNAAFQELKGGE